MKVFRNSKWTRRNHDCTNVIACVGAAAPAAHWVEADRAILDGLTRLWVENGVEFYGHL